MFMAQFTMMGQGLVANTLPEIAYWLAISVPAA